MPDFPIVDAHVHIYDPTRLHYAWMKGVPLLNKPHLPAYYSERSAPVRIEKFVFVEVDVTDAEQVEEARWVGEIGDKRLGAIVAAAPLEKGSAVEVQIAALAKLPLVKGVRRLIQHHANELGWCLRPDFVEGVKLLAKYGLTFDICIFHPQMADAIELVKRCPDVSFILDHIGKPGIRDGLREPWWSGVRELARLPNVVCKISGVVTEADHKSWTYDQVAPYIAHAIECFGFDRSAFGSDWSVSELATTYAKWIETVDKVIAGASETERRALYRDTATRFYRL